MPALLSRSHIVATALVLSLAGSISACSGGDMTDSDSHAMTSSAGASSTRTAGASSTSTAGASDASSMTMAKGAYLSLADYEKQMADRSGSTVVYFFHASWCPDCKATDAALMSQGVPDGLTVVKVDYDTATDLKKKYDVTIQHTFVAVDSSGMATKKWTGAKDGDAIKAMAG